MNDSTEPPAVYFLKTPDRVEAERILDAFVSGYIEDENHPDVIAAGRVLGKRPVIKRVRGFANPESFLTVSTVKIVRHQINPVRSKNQNGEE